MPPARSRYVTACQQLLALGVVLVALAPATRVVSLDVVGAEPSHGAVPAGLSSQAAVRTGAHGAARGAVRPSAYRMKVVRLRSAEPAWHHGPGQHG